MISWPAICPFRYLSDTVYSSWEYGRPTPHWLHLYWWPVERARSEKKDAIWPIISTAALRELRDQQLSYGHYDRVHPRHPHPRWAKGQLITCLCFVNSLALHGGTIALQRCTGRSAIIRRPIVISKRQIFPRIFQNRRITFATHPHGTTFY